MRTSSMRYPPPGRRPGPPPAFSWAPYIVIGLVLFTVLMLAPRIGVMPLIILLVVGIPIIRNLITFVSRTAEARRHEAPEANARPEKRKNRTYRAGTSYAQEAEKPKREPEYTVGDDGELVELDAVLEDEKPRQRQSGRDSFV